MAHRTRARVAVIDVVDTTTETRFGKNVKPLPNGCWQFSTSLDRYHRFTLGRTDGRMHAVTAHRFAYETLVGPIPEGHHLHHTCEHPGCVNPEHLVPLTPADHAAAHVLLRSAS